MHTYLIPETCLVFIFAYMAYLPMFTIARHYEHRDLYNFSLK